MDLDALDRRLLLELQTDARQSMRSLARKVGVSTPTVSARIQRLEESAVIQGYSVRVAPQWADAQVALVDCTPNQTARLLQSLQGLDGVEHVAQLAGGPLLVGLKGAPQATAARLHEVAANAGATYRLHAVISNWHGSPSAPPRVAVPCHFCTGNIQGEPSRAVLDGRPHVFCCNQCRSAFISRYEEARKQAGTQLPIVKAKGVK